VRVSPEERKRVELAAKASKQNASQWIRSTLASAIGG
jgi:predicted HicB family RNase H-like nuclease